MSGRKLTLEEKKEMIRGYTKMAKINSELSEEFMSFEGKEYLLDYK